MSNVVDIRTRQTYATPPSISNRTMGARRSSAGRLTFVDVTMLLCLTVLAVLIFKPEIVLAFESEDRAVTCAAPGCHIDFGLGQGF